MIATELQTALEAALEAKSVAVQKLKEAKLRSKNEIDNLRTQAEQALKASELQAVELKEKHEKELMLQLQKQEIAISDSFRARIESMEIALQDSSAEAADCARGELAATEQLAILTKQLDRLKGESEAASNTNITNENLERTIQELSTTLENNDVTAKRSLDALNEELCAMRSAEKEARETCVTLSDDLVKLQSVVRNIEEEMLVSEKEAAQQAVSDSKIDALTREKASLLAELQQLQAEVAARDETDTEASEQRELSLAISTALFNEKEMQMAAAIADKNLFEEKLASMAEELEALRVSTLDTVRAETPPAVGEEGLEERYHSIVLQRDSLIARCSSLEDELNDLQSTANDTSVLSVGIEVQGLRDQLKEAEERLKEADSQVAVKDELLQLRENDVELMDNERTKSEEQISSLQKELKALKTQLATQLESSTETAERAVIENKVVGELEVKVEGGQPSSEGSPVVRKDELENIVATQVSEISALLSAVEELETKCSTSAADLTQLTEEINASVTVVLERDATVESLKAENIALKKALRETTALLESERSTVAESEDSIFNLQAECSSAQQKVLLLEKSLETAVDSKINADIVLQKSIEDAEAARIFAENLLEQSIGDDDTRAGAELALKANMEIAEKQFKSLEAALRTELQEAIEEKMRSESELEEAFNAKTAGEQMLKDLLREATEGQKTAESALSDALKATAKLEEKLAKSKETLKREKELFSSSESRIEEVEAAAEKEIAVQLLRQEGIIAATFKGRIEDLEAIVQKSETMLEIARMDAIEKEKGELEARRELTHLRDQLALVQSDLERAETARREAEEAAEGHRENSDSVRAEIEAKYRATMEAAEEQFKSLENDLTNDLRDALNAKINAEIDLEKALSEKAQVEAALRICEEDLKLTDKEANDAEARLISQNRTLTELEDNIQERVVENASLREELKRANALYQGLEVTYLQSGQALSNVRADLEAALAERESASLSAKQQIDTAIEEIEFHKSSSRAAEARLEDLSATHAAAEKTIAEMKAREKDYIEKLSVAQDAGMRVAEAEEALSRVEDKKKRDLENLKKQNERISAVQVR
jgi:chromosome segregation ATPase